MSKRDLDRALILHSALMQAVIAHPGGRDDPAAMSHVSSLCQSAVEVVNDLDARVAIRGIESLARLLFSADGHEGMKAGSLRGVEALKFQIFNALSNLRGRLQILQYVPSKPELPALEAQKNLRILVVEDNREAASSLRKLLELCGYSVTIAGTSQEGLAAAQEVRPDIVLCDIGLPDQDGYAFATALRGNPVTARARLIAVTAYGSEEDRQRSREAGFQLHLVKPVKPETLLRQLEKPVKPETVLQQLDQPDKSPGVPKRRPTLIDDFIAKSDSGTRYRVYVWQHWLDDGTVPGRKEVRLATGERVNRIDDDNYEIAQTGVLIKRER